MQFQFGEQRNPCGAWGKDGLCATSLPLVGDQLAIVAFEEVVVFTMSLSPLPLVSERWVPASGSWRR